MPNQSGQNRKFLVHIIGSILNQINSSIIAVSLVPIATGFGVGPSSTAQQGEDVVASLPFLYMMLLTLHICGNTFIIMCFEWNKRKNSFPLFPIYSVS